MSLKDEFIQVYIDIRDALTDGDEDKALACAETCNAMVLSDYEKNSLIDLIYGWQPQDAVIGTLVYGMDIFDKTDIAVANLYLHSKLLSDTLTREILVSLIDELDSLHGEGTGRRNYIITMIKACESVGNMDEMSALRTKLLEMGVIE